MLHHALLAAVRKRGKDGLSWQLAATLPVRINAFASGQERIVAVGRTGRVFTTDDGTAWVERTSNAGSNELMNVIYADGVFVSCGGSGALIRSANGSDWSDVKPSQSSGFRSLCYAAALDRFVVSGNTNPYYSATGSGWSAGSGSPLLYQGLIHSAYLEKFIGVAGGDNSSIWNSANGISWTQQGALSGWAINALAHDEASGLLVGVGYSGTATPVVYTSPDGYTWTLRHQAAWSGQLYHVAYVQELGQWVAVGGSFSVAARVLFSPNGIDWITRDPGLTTHLIASHYDPRTDRLLVSAYHSTTGIIYWN